MRLSPMVFFGITVLCLCSCSTKESTTTTLEVGEAAEWADMDSFHTIMSEAFHPYHDSANLEPARRLAEEMAQQASLWASASLPERVNNDDMKNQLNQLKVDTRNLAEMITAGASGDDIGASLAALHESFHGIMESWNSSEIQEH